MTSSDQRRNQARSARPRSARPTAGTSSDVVVCPDRTIMLHWTWPPEWQAVVASGAPALPRGGDAGGSPLSLGSGSYGCALVARGWKSRSSPGALSAAPGDRRRQGESSVVSPDNFTRSPGTDRHRPQGNARRPSGIVRRAEMRYMTQPPPLFRSVRSGSIPPVRGRGLAGHAASDRGHR